MSLQTSTHVKTYTKTLVIFTALIVSIEAVAGWEIDLSRRRRETQKQNEKSLRSDDQAVGFMDRLLPTQGTGQEIVVLNTESGFLPKTLHLKRGETYTLHVVNVNEKEKNTSFIIDVFKEHHSTYYGQIKSFTVKPDKDGIFTFQCPETSLEGRVVIYSDSKESRTIANQKE